MPSRPYRDRTQPCAVLANFRVFLANGHLAEVLPLPCTVELIKGRKTARGDMRNEQMFRVPATEELWEVTCSEERDGEEREVPAARKRPNFPIAS